MKTKKSTDMKYLARLFWIFIVGSLVGFAYENILVLCQKGHFILRQGLLYGPLIPVYGVGAVIYELTIPILKIDANNYSAFSSISAIDLSSVVDYHVKLAE